MVDALKDLIRRQRDDAQNAGVGCPYSAICIDSFTVRYNGTNLLVIGPSKNVDTIATTFGKIGMLLHPYLVNGAVTLWYAAPKPAPKKSVPPALVVAAVSTSGSPLLQADLESASLPTVVRHILQFCAMPFECLGLSKFVNDETVQARYTHLVQRFLDSDKREDPQTAKLLEAIHSARNRCLAINARRKIMFANK